MCCQEIAEHRIEKRLPARGILDLFQPLRQVEIVPADDAEPSVGLEAESQLKSQGKWLGVGGTFLWDFTYLCWNLTFDSKSPTLSV